MFARIVALTGFLAIGAAPARSEPLQPTGKWVVEFAANDCLVSRQYGSPGKALILVLRKFPMDQNFGLLVLRSDWKRGYNSGTGRLRFGESVPVEAGFGAFQLSPGIRKIEFGTDDDGAYDNAASSATITVEIPNEVKAEFAVPNLKSALSLLNQCASNLGQAWGVPKESQRQISRPARLLSSKLVFSSDDYPIGALKNDASGFAVVRYVVDEFGHPSDCVVVKSSESRDLDRATCSKLMRRAQYDPALDQSGKPVRSFKFLKVSWLLYG